MPKFRKKPVTIEARQISAVHDDGVEGEELDSNTASIATISGWMMAYGFRGFRVWGASGPFGLAIQTLEGEMVAIPGDWIIREPYATDDRKFYPCKPDIFEATYERADA